MMPRLHLRAPDKEKRFLIIQPGLVVVAEREPVQPNIPDLIMKGGDRPRPFRDFQFALV